MTSMRRRIAGTAIAALLAAGAAAAETRTFDAPLVGDRRLDLCLYWGRDCGQPAADAWCREQGFESATAFAAQDGVGRSFVLGDRKACDGDCDAFRAVTCQRSETATKRLQSAKPDASAPSTSAPSATRAGTGTVAAAPGTPIIGDDTDARIAQLQEDVRLLFEQIAELREQQRELSDSVTFLKANAVRPVCSADGTHSVHPNGQRENCSPYACNAVEGVCRKQCTRSDQCARNHVCEQPSAGHAGHYCREVN
jgi:hypothetical protein